MRWARWSYPILFALFPLLGMAALDPGWYRLRSVVIVAGIVMAATIVIIALLTVILRARYAWDAAADRAALLTLLLIVVFYGIDTIPRPSARQHPMLYLAAAVVAGGVALWAHRARWHERLLARAPAYLLLMGGVLCAWSIVRVLYYPVATRIALHRSTLLDSLEKPIAVNPAGVRAPQRDVFVIVLDEYASTQVLRDRFGYDNRPFEDSLRALGFRIPLGLRSNYANTIMSVGSLVNFAQTAGIASTAGRDSHDYGPAAYLIEHNRAARFLRSRGYKYVFFPSTWYAPTRYSTEADVEFYPYRHFRVARRIYRSEFMLDFVNGTILNRVLPAMGDRSRVYQDHVVRTMTGVAALEPTRQPTFAFAHVLMPHVPYVVDRHCRPVVSVQRDEARAREQLACIDSLVLQTVTTILQRSRVAPIIVLQGDHGTQSLNVFASRTRLPSRLQAAERFQPFGAYYLPAGGGAAVPDSTSVVNVLRYVFAYYYGADLPPLPNTMYYSHWKFPYRLTQLTPEFTPVGGYTAATAPLPLDSALAEVGAAD